MLLRIYHFLLRHVPFKLSLLRAYTMLPSFCKNSWSYRAACTLASHCPQDEIISSNYGLDKKLRFQTRISNTIQCFGKPSLYREEYPSLLLCESLLAESDCFVDVGAHMAYYDFFLHKEHQHNKPFYIFEPDPQLNKEIQMNIERNLIKHMHLEHFALSDHSGQVPFYQNLSDRTSGSLKSHFATTHQTQMLEIPCIPLDAYEPLKKHQHYLIKADVEFAEREFLIGAEHSLANTKFLLLELLKDAIEENLPIDIAKKHGFEAYYVGKFRLQSSTDGHFSYDEGQFNWLFSRANQQEVQGIAARAGFRFESN